MGFDVYYGKADPPPVDSEWTVHSFISHTPSVTHCIKRSSTRSFAQAQVHSQFVHVLGGRGAGYDDHEGWMEKETMRQIENYDACVHCA